MRGPGGLPLRLGLLGLLWRRYVAQFGLNQQKKLLDFKLLETCQRAVEVALALQLHETPLILNRGLLGLQLRLQTLLNAVDHHLLMYGGLYLVCDHCLIGARGKRRYKQSGGKRRRTRRSNVH